MVKTVLIIGGSYAGLSAAHALLQATFPTLPGYDLAAFAKLTREEPTKGSADVDADTDADAADAAASPYRVLILTPAPTFFARTVAPRLLAAPESLPDGGAPALVPLRETLAERYPVELHPRVRALDLVHGSALAIDPAARTVTYAPAEKRPDGTAAATATLTYSALVVASGWTHPFPLFNPLGPGESAADRLADCTGFAAALAALRRRGLDADPSRRPTVIVGGGGASGVELAAEIAEAVNAPGLSIFSRSSPWERAKAAHARSRAAPAPPPTSGRAALRAALDADADAVAEAAAGGKGSQIPPVRVVLVTAGRALLADFRSEKVSALAVRYLARLGVDVVTELRVTDVRPADAKPDPADPAPSASLAAILAPVTVSFENASAAATTDAADPAAGPTQLAVDLYVPCAGGTANTAFVPPAWLAGSPAGSGAGRVPAEMRQLIGWKASVMAGAVRAHPETLQVRTGDGPGGADDDNGVFAEDVYVVGDIAVPRAGSAVLDAYQMGPVVASQIGAVFLRQSVPDGDVAPAGKEPKKNNSQMKRVGMVPIGRTRGVGVIFGWSSGWPIVWLVKCRNYMIGLVRKAVKS